MDNDSGDDGTDELIQLLRRVRKRMIKTINRPYKYSLVETSCVYQDFVTVVQQMLSSSVPVKTVVTIGPKDP